jgi:thiamine-monophosphate kinase
MRESELHRRIYANSRDMRAGFPYVLIGPGDDCAVVKPGAASLLLTVDQVVEGRHFTPGTPVDLIARKVVARSISDIAAMGGTPRWALATGLLPNDFAAAPELTDALHRWSEHWSTPMVGGDIASALAGTPLVLTVTVGGDPHPGRGPVLRSGAKAGDVVYVTGALGGSLLSGRHLSFEPRLREATWLCDTLGEHLHAMIDISDGLGRDAGRIAEASGVRIDLDSAQLPLHPGLTDSEAAIREGEDYELCFTLDSAEILPARTPQGTPLTRIGRVSAGAGCFTVIDGRSLEISDLGWDHGR